MRSTSPRRRSVFASRLVNSAPDRPDVIGDLRHAILAGAEPPGTLIPIADVAAFFDVSQIPVREALKVLTGEGLVEHQPHIGYAVAQLTFAEFRELYDVRAALEAAALREAVRHAGPADDELARETHVRLAGSVDDPEGGPVSYHSASRLFHMALIAPARMPRLVHMYESAWNVTEPVRPMTRLPAARRQELHDDHGRMLDAFLRRDAALLVAESAHHFDNLKTAIDLLRAEPVFRAD